MDDLYNRVSRRRRRGQQGFTLIELLVVIAVLAILAAIVIFNVLGVSNRGATSSCETDAKSVQTASDAYRNDNKVYPNNATQANDTATTANAQAVQVTQLVPTYLHTSPANTETFFYSDANGTVVGSLAGAVGSPC